MNDATPPSDCVTDTQALVLRLESRTMGASARLTFEAAEAGSTVLYIPALVLAEIMYLSQKKRIATTLTHVAQMLARFPNYREYPLNFEIVQSADEITDIPELHDRLIAGTARRLGLPLITNDMNIRASAFVSTLWD
jgi:predicted nucleic acid-binding protein